jgi:CRP/FNR family cyclic AMP-dependent transcriptional regulator
LKLELTEKTGQVQRFGAGQMIFKEGTPGKIMFLIKSGRVKLTRDVMKDEKKVTVTLGILSKNDYFGEMALFDYGARSATATAMGEVITKVITHKDLEAMIEESPRLAWLFLKRMSERIRVTDNKIETLLVREKLSKKVHDELDLIRYPEYLKQVT